MKQRSIWAVGIGLISLIGVLFFSQLHDSRSGAAIAQDRAAVADMLMVQAEDAPAEVPTDAPAIPELTGNFEDPQGRFQVGILDGFAITTVAGNPLLESADGNLAYTVVVLPTGSTDDAEVALTDAALAQAVKTTFAQGEGFQTTGFEAIPDGGVQIAWAGRLSVGGSTQPVQGRVLAKQAEQNIFLIAIAATDDGAPLVDPALTALSGSLQIL